MPEPVVVIGGGPAGLMAAEIISAAGIQVDVYDAMPTVGRKFLRAGIGGLNLTHAEAMTEFVARYGSRKEVIATWLENFPPQALRDWASGLGIETFVGSSGRVFPVGMKAAPLLRAWLQRLRQQGVRFHLRHRWQGWDSAGALHFISPEGSVKVGRPKGIDSGTDGTTLILALGGGSWSRLGSDGAWLPWLAAWGVAIAPLRPANCGFNVDWSPHLRDKFAGTPVKSVTASIGTTRRTGEFVVSRHGLEGSLIYALAAELRDRIECDGPATLTLDLAPGRSQEQLATELARPRGRDSLANHLRRRVGIDGVKAALLREIATTDQLNDAHQLATLIKALPLALQSPRPIDEAISTAGGVDLDALDEHLMLKALPGVFCAGEMLDWEAPTGGYLLTACMASGRIAAEGVLHRLKP
jgi:uncharacterized flavoprotein (TIGR03862 family)